MKKMVSFGLWALAVIVPGQAAAQTAQQFDVVCTVEEQWRSQTPLSGGATSGLEQVDYRFRVDLAGRKFCVDHCKVFFDLTDANTGSNLDLTYRPMIGASEVPYDNDRQVTLNRVTGGISTNYNSRNITARGTGQCRREPFSGFPEAVF